MAKEIKTVLYLLVLGVYVTQEVEELNSTTDKFNLSNFFPFECKNSTIDCSNNGECTLDRKDCECFHGFSTFFINFTHHFQNAPRCNYKSKKQLYALVLSCFISFGAAHFYLENYLMGYFQLGFFIFIFLYNTVFIIRLSLKHLKPVTPSEWSHTLIHGLVIFFLSCAFVVWYFFDLAMLIMNMYKDGNNQDIALFL